VRKALLENYSAIEEAKADVVGSSNAVPGGAGDFSEEERRRTAPPTSPGSSVCASHRRRPRPGQRPAAQLPAGRGRHRARRKKGEFSLNSRKFDAAITSLAKELLETRGPATMTGRAKLLKKNASFLPQSATPSRRPGGPRRRDVHLSSLRDPRCRSGTRGAMTSSASCAPPGSARSGGPGLWMIPSHSTGPSESPWGREHERSWSVATARGVFWRPEASLPRRRARRAAHPDALMWQTAFRSGPRVIQNVSRSSGTRRCGRRTKGDTSSRSDSGRPAGRIPRATVFARSVQRDGLPNLPSGPLAEEPAWLRAGKVPSAACLASAPGRPEDIDDLSAIHTEETPDSALRIDRDRARGNRSSSRAGCRAGPAAARPVLGDREGRPSGSHVLLQALPRRCAGASTARGGERRRFCPIFLERSGQGAPGAPAADRRVGGCPESS